MIAPAARARTPTSAWRTGTITALVVATIAFASAASGVSTPPPLPEPAAFSALRAAGSLAPWTSVTIAVGKRRTCYELVVDAGSTVLHAIADNAASALAYPMHVELRDAPVLAWRWKIAGLIDDADSRQASREDAPAPVIMRA